MTFDEALGLVPENWHLVRDLDKVLRGDYFMPPESYGSWFPVVHENEIGTIYDHRSCLCLRPIPEDVRHAEARHIENSGNPMLTSSLSPLWKWVLENRR